MARPPTLWCAAVSVLVCVGLCTFPPVARALLFAPRTAVRTKTAASSSVRHTFKAGPENKLDSRRDSRTRLFSGCLGEFSVSREVKNVRVFEGDFAEDICEAVAAVGSEAIAYKGLFSLAIPGGSVVKALSGLADDAFDFSKMHIFFCNERIGENKNYQGALDAFVTAKNIPLENVHGVGEGTADDVASKYSELLWTHPSLEHDGGLPSLDLVLLGTGADGHCGSLYPESAEIKATGLGKLFVPVEGKDAIAMTMDTMCAARIALISAATSSRAEMVCKALSGKFGDFDCPAGMVDAKEETLWFVDEDSVADFYEYQDAHDDEYDEDDEDD